MQDFHLNNRDGLDIHLANLLKADLEPLVLDADVFALQHVFNQDHVRNIDNFIKYFGEA